MLMLTLVRVMKIELQQTKQLPISNQISKKHLIKCQTIPLVFAQEQNLVGQVNLNSDDLSYILY